MTNREFELPAEKGVISFRKDVLLHMYSHCQRHKWSKEAGGQLFSPDPTDSVVEITHSTGPYKTDQRSRHSFNPDVSISNHDRTEHFKNGLHAVGLWHTHPENFPIPSYLDRRTTEAYLNATNGELEYFMLVILGNSGNPPNLSLWLTSNNNENQWIELNELLLPDPPSSF